jgi:hypothetical protein
MPLLVTLGDILMNLKLKILKKRFFTGKTDEPLQLL